MHATHADPCLLVAMSAVYALYINVWICPLIITYFIGRRLTVIKVYVKYSITLQLVLRMLMKGRVL